MGTYILRRNWYYGYSWELEGQAQSWCVDRKAHVKVEREFRGYPKVERGLGDYTHSWLITPCDCVEMSNYEAFPAEVEAILDAYEPSETGREFRSTLLSKKTTNYEPKGYLLRARMHKAQAKG